MKYKKNIFGLLAKTMKKEATKPSCPRVVKNLAAFQTVCDTITPELIEQFIKKNEQNFVVLGVMPDKIPSYHGPIIDLKTGEIVTNITDYCIILNPLAIKAMDEMDMGGEFTIYEDIYFWGCNIELMSMLYTHSETLRDGITPRRKFIHILNDKMFYPYHLRIVVNNDFSDKMYHREDFISRDDVEFFTTSSGYYIASLLSRLYSYSQIIENLTNREEVLQYLNEALGWVMYECSKELDSIGKENNEVVSTFGTKNWRQSLVDHYKFLLSK